MIVFFMASVPLILTNNYEFSRIDVLVYVMIVNTNKTKVMIIKSKNITYANFVYDNNNLEEVTSYKNLEVDLHHKLN
jgi:hypothetical protein